MAGRVLVMTVLVLVFANAGDLAFSSVKRRLSAMDLSSALAGHGDVLDRFGSRGSSSCLLSGDFAGSIIRSFPCLFCDPVACRA
jgi:hypothetical protein